MTLDHIKPTLRALQVFESAARCGSFTAAGIELGVTQSAVSRQISDLEGILGVSLFIRNGVHVSPSPVGNRLAQQLNNALSLAWAAVADARRSEHVVTLSMLPSVASRWFAPRLAGFLDANPNVDLRISASKHLVDFNIEGVDAAIRYVADPGNGVDATRLGHETITPVCTPEYAHRLQLMAPEDIRRATLLLSDIEEDWSLWFDRVGLGECNAQGPRLGDAGAIMEAVLAHQGIALGRSRLVEDYVRTGRLVAPFDEHLEASRAYWFVQPKGGIETQAVAVTRQWLIAQFAMSQ